MSLIAKFVLGLSAKLLQLTGFFMQTPSCWSGDA